eukprot:s1569_g11.t1
MCGWSCGPTVVATRGPVVERSSLGVMALEAEPLISWEQLQLALRTNGDLGLGESRFEFLRGSLESFSYLTEISPDLLDMVLQCSLAQECKEILSRGGLPVATEGWTVITDGAVDWMHGHADRHCRMLAWLTVLGYGKGVPATPALVYHFHQKGKFFLATQDGEQFMYPSEPYSLHEHVRVVVEQLRDELVTLGLWKTEKKEMLRHVAQDAGRGVCTDLQKRQLFGTIRLEIAPGGAEERSKGFRDFVCIGWPLLWRSANFATSDATFSREIEDFNQTFMVEAVEDFNQTFMVEAVEVQEISPSWIVGVWPERKQGDKVQRAACFVWMKFLKIFLLQSPIVDRPFEGCRRSEVVRLLKQALQIASFLSFLRLPRGALAAVVAGAEMLRFARKGTHPGESSAGAAAWALARAPMASCEASLIRRKEILSRGEVPVATEGWTVLTDGAVDWMHGHADRYCRMLAWLTVPGWQHSMPHMFDPGV